MRGADPADSRSYVPGTVRRMVTIAVATFVTVAGLGSAALYAYDESRSDILARGVTLAGIDVGSMPLPEARATLRREIELPLEQPLTLAEGRRRRFRVEPELLGVRTNVEALLKTALAESRDGTFLARSLRNLAGHRLDVDLPLRVFYAHGAMDVIVAAAGRELERPARDAQSHPSFSGVRITSSRAGVAVRATALRAAITERLARPQAPRTIRVATAPVEPTITTRKLKSRYRHFVAISRRRMELRLFVDGELSRTYRVGVGRAGFETPVGEYEIETKAADPAWYVPDSDWAGDLAGKVIPAGDPRNPLEARWMGFWDGAGIHGTANEGSIGTAASHGCIRMTVPDVIDLYSRVPVDAKLYIE